jgi:hypothetical protein
MVGKEVGWRMSTSEIRNCLQRRDPVVFVKISWTTINKWIDQSGPKPRWSDNALWMAENGNHQLHPNAGHHGVLVSHIKVVSWLVLMA